MQKNLQWWKILSDVWLLSSTAGDVNKHQSETATRREIWAWAAAVLTWSSHHHLSFCCLKKSDDQHSKTRVFSWTQGCQAHFKSGGQPWYAAWSNWGRRSERIACYIRHSENWFIFMKSDTNKMNSPEKNILFLGCMFSVCSFSWGQSHFLYWCFLVKFHCFNRDISIISVIFVPLTNSE